MTDAVDCCTLAAVCEGVYVCVCCRSVADNRQCNTAAINIMMMILNSRHTDRFVRRLLLFCISLNSTQMSDL